MNIREVEGIGDVYGAKLAEASVGTTEALLTAGASPAGREHLARQVGVSPSHILEWVNRVDLMRVKGVGSEYSDLLEAAGVDTVPELAQRNPANLAEAISKTIEAKGLVRRAPSASDIESWVAHAKELGRAITY
jgi:predicted flap endonuclease-1-like 5' DNA nuclease